MLTACLVAGHARAIAASRRRDCRWFICYSVYAMSRQFQRFTPSFRQHARARCRQPACDAIDDNEIEVRGEERGR